MARDKITPTILVEKIRENLNNNGTISSIFSNQFLSKFDNVELNGIKKSIDKELCKREKEEAKKMKEALERLGYKVNKE